MSVATAPANIAFIKYWGMRDSEQTLPYHNSLSMNLDRCVTRTRVEFDAGLGEDEVWLTFYQQERKRASGMAYARVVAQLDRLRRVAGVETRAYVESQNTFPSDAGIASSASGFAALTVAAAGALGLELGERELSQWARRSGSGSACRSIPDGYVEWYNGDDAESVAESVAPAEHWELVDIVAIVDTRAKKIGSAENHRMVQTSPYFAARLADVAGRIGVVREAILGRDLTRLGEAMEADAVSLHVVCMTQQPPSFYWTRGTMAIMHAVRSWREAGLEAYFTIDAGPNVHVMTSAAQCETVRAHLEALEDVRETLVNRPGRGAWLHTEDDMPEQGWEG